MENTIEEYYFRRRLRTRLNRLAKLYSKDDRLFLKDFMNTPEEVLKEIVRCRLRIEDYRTTKLGDLAEYASEILYYYQAAHKKVLSQQKVIEEANESIIPKGSKENGPNDKVVKSFTLHNPRDLIRFEGFLDRMLRLLELSPSMFLKTLPKCPVELWDKIDDLRETSYKADRDSPEYTRCLDKCKKISLTYFKLSNPKGITDEEES